MTIIRLLVIALLFWLIFRLIRIKMNKRRMVVKKPPIIDDIKQCSYCGVHIPAKDSMQSGDKFYCSSEHLNRDTQNK